MTNTYVEDRNNAFFSLDEGKIRTCLMKYNIAQLEVKQHIA